MDLVSGTRPERLHRRLALFQEEVLFGGGAGRRDAEDHSGRQLCRIDQRGASRDASQGRGL